jgi:hypothetical protein
MPDAGSGLVLNRLLPGKPGSVASGERERERERA